MLWFYVWCGCGLIAAGLVGYMIGMIVGEDRADARARRVAQDREARARGVVLPHGGRR